MNETESGFSPAYNGILKLVLAQQIPLGLLAGLITDGGGVATIFLYTMAGFWTGFAMIVMRRPRTPTKTDIFMIKWGTFLLFVVSCAMASVIWRWRGAV
ncbi:MAG: hypothetical protein C0404_04835 [Verrucomicrobia bacterium]|nr:hypothetical protein [Verrucomicrobiota bacterium]